MKYKLEELCEFITDGTHQTPEYCEEGVVIFLSSKDVTERKIDWDNVKHIPQSLHEKLYARLSPRKNDILLAKNGTTGVAALVDRDEIFDVYVSLAVLRPRDVVYPKYLLYAINSPVAKRQFDAGLKGVGVPNLHLSVIRQTEINIEEYEKQFEICEILDKVSSVIDARKQELQKLDNLIKARFVELFGHQSHNEKSLPYLIIDDVAEIYLGITHTPTYVQNGVMFISAKNTSGDFLDLSDVKYISREEFESAPKGSKPQINDVLFSRVGSNLGHPVILEEDLELCTFVSLGFLRTKGNVTSNYLKHWMRDDFFAKQVSEHVKGGGQPNLNTGWLKEFKIIVPDIECQREFDDFCKQIDKSKVAVQKALDEAQLLFDSLMQKYFG